MLFHEMHDVVSELDHALSASADNEAGAGSFYDDPESFGASLNLGGVDETAFEPLLQIFKNQNVPFQIFFVLAFDAKPARLPVADDAKPMRIWVYSVSHFGS